MKPEEKRPLGRLRRRWGYNPKIGLKAAEYRSGSECG
jgi:hypothetical protein